MTLHTGTSYRNNDIQLMPPDPDLVRDVLPTSDLAETGTYWLERALAGTETYLFSIYHRNTLVGQIFLHDTNEDTGESLVGYHLFQPADRGRGIGTLALLLLKQFVHEHTSLVKLVIITSQDNQASQRIAEKCGFVYSGLAREGSSLQVFQWFEPR